MIKQPVFNNTYQYGFHKKENPTYKTPVGLNKKIVEQISKYKQEHHNAIVHHNKLFLYLFLSVFNMMTNTTCEESKSSCETKEWHSAKINC